MTTPRPFGNPDPGTLVPGPGRALPRYPFATFGRAFRAATRAEAAWTGERRTAGCPGRVGGGWRRRGAQRRRPLHRVGHPGLPGAERVSGPAYPHDVSGI